jgi:hypothetical protein
VTNLICNPAGTGKQGATCTSVADCAIDYSCFTKTLTDGGTTATCLQYCSTGVLCTTGACTGSLSCGGVSNGRTVCQ